MIDPEEMGPLLQPLPDNPDPGYWDRQRAIRKLLDQQHERRN